jgi:hypothetical protein
MKTKAVIFKPHSVVDVITNSSTELFVGKPKFELDATMQLLQSILDVYNKINDKSLTTNIFNVYEVTEENYERTFEDIAYYNIPYYFKTAYKPKPDDWEDTDEWQKSLPDKLKRELIGHVVVVGITDNIIPYEIFELIEDLFTQGERIHLG